MRTLKYIIEIQLTEDIHFRDQGSLARLLKSAAKMEAECQLMDSATKIVSVTSKQIA